MENQGQRRRARGCDSRGKASRIRVAVPIFINLEVSLAAVSDHYHIFKRTGVPCGNRAFSANREVLHPLRRAEPVEVVHQLFHALPHALQHQRQRTSNVRLHWRTGILLQQRMNRLLSFLALAGRRIRNRRRMRRRRRLGSFRRHRQKYGGGQLSRVYVNRVANRDESGLIHFHAVLSQRDICEICPPSHIIFALGTLSAFAGEQPDRRHTAELFSAIELQSHVHGAAHARRRRSSRGRCGYGHGVYGCIGLLRRRGSRQDRQREYEYRNSEAPPQVNSARSASRTRPGSYRWCIVESGRVRSSCSNAMVLVPRTDAIAEGPSSRSDNASTARKPFPQYFCKRGASKRRRVISQHRPPHDLDRRKSLTHEIIVKLLQRKRRTFLLLHILAQFQNLQLTQGVIKIGWVRGPALRLHQPRFLRLISFSREKFHRLIEAHLAAVHFNTHDEPRIAQQRILQLPQANQFRLARILGARSRLPKSFIQHHLLAIMRPAFRVRSGAQQHARSRGRLMHPQKLHVVPRICLVRRSAHHRPHVESRHAPRDFLRRVVRSRQCHVEICFVRHFLEWPRRIHRCKRCRTHEWRCLLQNRPHVRRNRYDVLRSYERDQSVERVAKTLQQMVRRRMIRHQLRQHVAR